MTHPQPSRLLPCTPVAWLCFAACAVTGCRHRAISTPDILTLVSSERAHEPSLGTLSASNRGEVTCQLGALGNTLVARTTLTNISSQPIGVPMNGWLLPHITERELVVWVGSDPFATHTHAIMPPDPSPLGPGESITSFSALTGEILSPGNTWTTWCAWLDHFSGEVYVSQALLFTLIDGDEFLSKPADYSIAPSFP